MIMEDWKTEYIWYMFVLLKKEYLKNIKTYENSQRNKPQKYETLKRRI